MCFRPAEASSGVQPIDCANCGETIYPADDILPKFCPYCEEPLVAAEHPEDAPTPGAPMAPSAPAAPAVPGTPKPPAGI